MNTSVEKNNPEVFPGNYTSGIHRHKSLISPSNQKKKENSTKQNKNKTKTKQKFAITCVQRLKQETERFVFNCKQKKHLLTKIR